MKKFLCLLIFSTFLGSSFPIFTIGPVTVNAFRIIFVSFLFFHFWFERQIITRPITVKYKNILCVLILLNFLTVFLSPSISAWINGCIFYVINILIIYFVYIYTDTQKDLNNYILSFVSGLLLNMVVSVYEYNTQNHIIPDNYLQDISKNSWMYAELKKAPTAFLYNPNNIGFAVIIGLVCGLYFTKRFKSGWFIFAVWSALCIYVSFATGSRAAIILVFLAVILSVIFGTEVISQKAFTAIGFVVAGGVLYLIFENFIWEQLESSGILSTTSIADIGGGRWEILGGVWDASKKNFFLGAGPGAAEVLFEEGYNFESVSVHNFWAEFLITEGILSLIIFVVFYIRCIKVQFVLRHNDISNAIILVALLMFSVAVFIPPTIVTLHFVWIIFGFSIASEKLYFDKTGVMI